MDKWFNCYEGSRDGLFTRDSMRHPAKMSVTLCFKIFEHGERMGYWKKGDVVLDPMCGIFTTGICGAIMGYRVVGVELEQHFFTLAQQNIGFARPKFHIKGDCEILQGDARCLSELLRPKGIVTSPPYVDQRMASAICFKARKLYREGKIAEALVVLREQERHEIEAGWARAPRSDEHLLQRLKDDATDRYEGAIASPPYAGNIGGESGIDTEREKLSGKNAQHKIAQRYDATIASPPYADQQITQDSHFRSAREPNRPDAARNGRARYSAAVSSPPFLMPQGGAKGIAVDGYKAVVSSPPFTKPEGGKGEASNRFKHKDADPIGDRTYQPRTHGGAACCGWKSRSRSATS